MGLPVEPEYIGNSSEFLRRMLAINGTLPDLFNRMDRLKVGRAYRGIKGIEFREKGGQSQFVNYDQGKDILTIFPMNHKIGNRVDLAIYTGIGMRMWNKEMSNNQKVKWMKKYVYPKMNVIDKILLWLNKGTAFGPLLDMFLDADSRLQCIHIINALKKNSISVTKVKDLDLRVYPPTAEFTRSERPYSLRPILGAYNRELDDYEAAFSEYCSSMGSFRIAENSVKEQMLELFKSVTF
jgi:hypothetical protein